MKVKFFSLITAFVLIFNPLLPLISNAVEAEALQNIEVCFIILDANQAVRQQLAGNTVLELDLYDSVHLAENTVNTLSGPFETIQYSSTQTVNRDLLGNDGLFDAYCKTQQYSNSAGTEYAYTQVRLQTDNSNLEIVGYNDQFNIEVETTSDVFPYSNEFFDGVVGNESERDINADGHMISSDDREYRHLVVVVRDNTPIEEIDPPVIGINLNSGETTTDNALVDVGLSNTNNSELSFIRFGDSPEAISNQNWVSYSGFNGTTILPGSNTAGLKQLCVQVQDPLGQDSNIACDEIEFTIEDPEEPPVITNPNNPYPATGAISINQDAIYTNTKDVTLNLSYTGTAPMYVRFVQTDNQASAPTPQTVYSPSDNQNGWTYWQNYQAAVQWSLNGNHGVKTVYSQYMYANNSVSAVTRDSIIFAPYYSINYNSIDHAQLRQGGFVGTEGSDYELVLPEYTLDNVPTSMETGEKLVLKLNAQNKGTYSWELNKVNVTYYWKAVEIAPEFQPFVNEEVRGNNAGLPSVVKYSESTGTLSLQVTAPSYPGRYQLVIDTVDEGIAKFSQFNNPTPIFEINVNQQPGTSFPQAPAPETGDNTGYYPDYPQAGQVHTITGYVREAPSNAYGAPYMIVETDGSGAVWYIIQYDIGQYVNQVITAPIQFTNDGSYNFNLVGWDSALVSYPSNTITLRRGDTVELEIRYLNTGYNFWEPGTTRLGSQQPQDRNSIFFHAATWLSQGRIPMANTNTVKYGDVARFRFKLNVPTSAAAGSYRECFRPLAEGITWIPADDTSKDVCLNIVVTNSVTPPVNNLPPLPPAPTGEIGYVVRYSGLNILAGPSTGFPVVTTIPYGTAVTVIGEVQFAPYSHWLKVRTTNGTEGWVPAGSIDHVNDPEDISFALNNTYIASYICGSSLSVHSGPGDQYPVSEVLPWGTNTYILMNINGWQLILLPNAQTGWVKESSQLCNGHYRPTTSYGNVYGSSSSGNTSGQTYFEGQVFSRPLAEGSYVITQNFGNNDHKGTDYAAACGTPVIAIADGVVSYTQTGYSVSTYRDAPPEPKYTGIWYIDAGLRLLYETSPAKIAYDIHLLTAYNQVNLVRINHDNGTQSRYLHLQDVWVSPGQWVARGQEIGTVGNTGWSTGCHLHLELGANHDEYPPRLDPESVFQMESPAHLIDAANSVRGRELGANYATAGQPNGVLHEYCGAYIKDYYYFQDAGQSWQTYTNLIYNPRTGQSLRLRGDMRIAYWDKYQGTCGELGLPTTDDLWAATSPLGTTGAYQQFDNGVIHSSAKGTFATAGRLNELHALKGGTAYYGFPTGEMYTSASRGKCQQFEKELLCEIEPAAPVDTRSPAEKAIDLRATQLGSSGASSLSNVCGYPSKYYNKIFGNEDGTIVYVNGKAIYSYGGTLDTFNYYSDKCERFGIMTADPQTGGVGPFNTQGAFQDFTKGRIYWSWKYAGKFVYGAIRTKFENAGGTNSQYGWPKEEVKPVNENGTATQCQVFEGGRICEQEITPYSEAQKAFKEVFGSYPSLVSISNFCGGVQKINIPTGIAYYDPNYRNVRIITGPIYNAWGENCNLYGLPENDTTRVSGFGNVSGYAQRFNKSPKQFDFYYQDGGSVVILEGNVKSKYDAKGGLGRLGFAKNSSSNPYTAVGRCNNSGSFWELGNGRIYQNGASYHLVYSDTLVGAYFFGNEADKRFGLPMNDESTVGSYSWQDFLVTRIAYSWANGFEVGQTTYCPGEEPTPLSESELSIKAKVESLGGNFDKSQISPICDKSTHGVSNGIVVYDPAEKQSFVIRDEFTQYWKDNCNVLGIPAEDTNMSLNSNYSGRVGKKQEFQNDRRVADLYYSTYTNRVIELEGQLRQGYINSQGFDGLGFIDTTMHNAAGVACGNREGRFWNLENGRIYLNNGNYYAVRANNAVGEYFYNNGADTKFGLPTSNQTQNSFMASQSFELTNLVWVLNSGVSLSKEPGCGDTEPTDPEIEWPELDLTQVQAWIQPTKKKYLSTESPAFYIVYGSAQKVTIELSTQILTNSEDPATYQVYDIYPDTTGRLIWEVPYSKLWKTVEESSEEITIYFRSYTKDINDNILASNTETMIESNNIVVGKSIGDSGKPVRHPIDVNLQQFLSVTQTPSGTTSHGGDAAIDFVVPWGKDWPVQGSSHCLRMTGMPVKATIAGYAYYFTGVYGAETVVIEGDLDDFGDQYSVMYMHLTSQSMLDYEQNSNVTNIDGYPYGCDKNALIYSNNKESYPISTQQYDGNTRSIFYNNDECLGEMVQPYNLGSHNWGEFTACKIRVEIGDTIGFVNHTGWSQTPHLHYEAAKNNNVNSEQIGFCDGSYAIDCTEGLIIK